MKKKKYKEPKKVIRRCTAKAKCASFDIEITAQFSPHGLANSDVNDIQRKLKQKIANAVAGLPFAHIYPFEVKMR